ncbi:MarR family transcriptional regulator [Ruegeria pomeroyi]|uniref:Transcriptional regulator, MarR family n=2 Tax=Ruegeria pomeroyi TaxID=89184 RepID=Q5LVU0_RUEPO|nr:MarR family transcriptional regulator [Ruegeria pomeroyi]AAV93920.1 transcriptional regulator, MarR family [Ruegeria pomeroyi DSS-3]NVK95474.1 MarR family transcriptional regulator [Ruegeria pomeroyi]NVL02950.1 MarR family transcriptional regulator [Ruegeria pomeroyi]QWV07509.1 MarR family transcriptional regulator [Ruegeria pomeroyi]
MKHKTQDRENQALVLALLRSQQLFMRAMGPVFRAHGLTAPQWDALETLANKGPVSMNDLMRFTLSTSGNLDVVIKNLIQAGLIEKSVDPEDKRGRILQLSPEGRRKVDDFIPIHNQALDQLFSGLGTAGKRQTITALNQLRKTLTQAPRG